MPRGAKEQKRSVRAALIVAFLVLFAATPALADSIAPGQIRVVDGDTIHVVGQRRSARLVGFNAPETSRAKCRAERTLGHEATRRLRQSLPAAGSTSTKFLAHARPEPKARRAAITVARARS
jgi:endonuclease YncB( thermonuclease family)